MDAVMIDTDVFSFFFKGDTRGEAYAKDVHDKQLCLSFMSVAELLRWAIAHQWGDAKRRSLEQSMSRCVVIPYDLSLAEYWANVSVQRSQAGESIACGDAWIAASALRHSVPLLTHNAKDFASIPGLQVISHG